MHFTLAWTISIAVVLGSAGLGRAELPRPKPVARKPPITTAGALSPYKQPALAALTGLYVADLLASHHQRAKQKPAARREAIALLERVLKETVAQLAAAKGDAAAIADLQKSVQASLADVRALAGKLDLRTARKLTTGIKTATLRAVIAFKRLDARAELKARVAALNALVGEDGLIGEDGVVALVGEDGLIGEDGKVALVGEDGLIGETGLSGLVVAIERGTKGVAKAERTGAELGQARVQLTQALRSKVTAKHRTSLVTLGQRTRAVMTALD